MVPISSVSSKKKEKYKREESKEASVFISYLHLAHCQSRTDFNSRCLIITPQTKSGNVVPRFIYFIYQGTTKNIVSILTTTKKMRIIFLDNQTSRSDNFGQPGFDHPTCSISFVFVFWGELPLQLMMLLDPKRRIQRDQDP